MRYWEFHAALSPYTIVRWAQLFTPATLLQTTINYWIQQIYNHARWDFNFTSVVIDKDMWEKVGTDSSEVVPYYIFTGDKLDVEQVIDAAETMKWAWKSYSYDQVKELWNFSQDEWSENRWFQFGNTIIAQNAETVTLSFYRGYKFLDYNKEHIAKQHIPLPDSFMPALDFLCKSNIDQIAVNTADGEQVTNYSKFKSQITDLKLKNKWNSWGITSNIK